MGTHVPEESIDLDPGKWYKVTVEDWAYPPFTPMACSIKFVNDLTGCVIGANIIAWIDGDFQCTDTVLIPALPNHVQKLVSTEGPFPDEATCLLEL